MLTAGDCLIFVGDCTSTNPPVSATPECGNDHDDQLVCKAGAALRLAQQQMHKGFSWVFLLDDDMYVNVANAHKAFSGFNASAPIALGIVGCGPHFCAGGGICGGPGIGISRAAMGNVMEQGESEFQKDAVGSALDVLTPWRFSILC